MPVTYVPWVILAVLIVAPGLLAVARKRRASLIATGCSVLFVAGLLLSVYTPGWLLASRARRGDAQAQYQFAKWHENHCEHIQAILPWPCHADVRSGYAWLKRSAANEYPPAMYALGVRLKYGQHVPKPKTWDAPTGNAFPQPEQGQRYINRAVASGYEPVIDEEEFYWHVFRGRHLDDPYD